jgi:hypothetical protein
MLIEVAATAGTDEQLAGLIEQALRRRLLDIHELAATLARHHGRPGSPTVRRLSTEYLPRADRKSGLERAFDRWLAKHPEIPEPQRNIRLGGWEIDCYWPGRGLAVELDGRPYHVLIEEIERDHRKDAWLQAHGKRILRITDARFRADRPGVHRDLTMLLGLSRCDRASQTAA